MIKKGWIGNWLLKVLLPWQVQAELVIENTG